MLQNLGQHIRTLRTQKGIGLNVFAEQLGVSSGYLSNLETGKAESIHLSLLEKLQDELFLFPVHSGTSDNVTDIRLSKIKHQLEELDRLNPEGVDYLLTTMEKGLNLLLKEK